MEEQTKSISKRAARMNVSDFGHGEQSSAREQTSAVYQDREMAVYKPWEEGYDPFRIDPSIVPEGWVYEWKDYSIANHPNGVENAYRSGYRPVPPSRHPSLVMNEELANLLNEKTDFIRVGQQILFERKKEDAEAEAQHWKEKALAGTEKSRKSHLSQKMGNGMMPFVERGNEMAQRIVFNPEDL